MKKNCQTVLSILYIAFIAFAAVTICSKASFLYPFDDSMDINCFMTVGKGITAGMVPYRDLYEQKGPILYFLSALAARISHTTFWGFWILEWVSAFFFLLFSWKILRLFSKNYALFGVPVTACIIYCSGAFAQGGSVEELCLPFFALALFLGIRDIHSGQKIRPAEYLVIGLTSALVLWIKFSLLGFYIGWIIVPFYMALKNKQIVSFLRGLFLIGTGVIIVSIPVLWWYAVQGALGDLLQVYFYNNIFVYTWDSGTLGKFRNMVSGLHLSLVYLPVPLLLAAFGIFYFRKRSTGISMLFFLSGLFSGAVVFSGGQGIQYYPMVLAPLCIIGIAALNLLIESRRASGVKNGRVLLAGLTSAAILGMFLFSSNTYLMKYQKADLPQFQFREIVCQEKDPTLLNYGFLDGGFYTACEIYPAFKYFCRYNIELPEMIKAQDDYIAQKIPSFIVTRNEQPVFSGYRCIASSSYYHEGGIQDYYLYKRDQETP